MIAVVRRKLTGELLYLPDVAESALCETMSTLFPANPTDDDLAKLLKAKPAGTYESICVQVPAATKCTALGVNRRDGYLSILASGSGNLFYELIGISGTATPAGGKKLFETDAAGYDVPAALGTGKAAYGGFYGGLPNGSYLLKIYDDAGGVSSYVLTIIDAGPLDKLKGTFAGSTGGSPGGGGGTPTTVYKGVIDHVSSSRRPDLMSIKVTTYQEADGSWWLKFDDTATGNFEKYYRGIGPGSWLTLAQLRTLRVPLGYLYAISCFQMSGPPNDSKINDQTAHCVQFIYTS